MNNNIPPEDGVPRWLCELFNVRQDWDLVFTCNIDIRNSLVRMRFCLFKEIWAYLSIKTLLTMYFLTVLIIQISAGWAKRNIYCCRCLILLRQHTRAHAERSLLTSFAQNRWCMVRWRMSVAPTLAVHYHRRNGRRARPLTRDKAHI